MIDYDKVYNITKNFTILYIEDDVSFLKETKSVFEEFFDRVDTATDGVEGLEKYKQYLCANKTPYDIVITDISMPYMNGIELTKEIYNIDKNQSIIVISAHDDSKYLLELLNMGIEQFLIKPIDFDILLTVLFGASTKIKKDETSQKDTKIIKLKAGFLWNTENSTLQKDTKIIKLTKKEILLMQILIKNAYRISTFQEIINVIYDDPPIISAEILQPLISRLRKKIPEQTIENVYGLGYRLVFIK
jgi:DNA-binding response OmpR family regulator